MAAYLRLGLWLIGAVMVIFFLLKRRQRVRRPTQAAVRIEKELKQTQDWNHHDWHDDDDDKHCILLPKTDDMADKAISTQSPLKIISLHVVAKSGCYFVAYDLLQTISATGMQFGEMNIFHYYLPNETGERTILFSLASATEPGDFDIDRMGEFTCSGLTLFMNLYQVPNAELAFSLMLDVAEQLAEDLDGDILADNHQPFTDDMLMDYQEKLTHYQTRRYECTAPDYSTS